MALRLIEGFNYDVSGIYSRSGSNVHDASAGRNGTGCWFMNSGGTLFLPAPVAEGATIVIGFAMKKSTDSFASTNRDFCQVQTPNGQVFRLTTGSTDDTWTVEVGGTDYGVISVGDAWAYYEVVVYMHDTTGTIEVFKDGLSVYSTSGIDTKGAVGDIAGLQWESTNNGIEYYLDDVYVLDDQGGGHTSRLGDMHVQTLDVTGHGNYKAGVGSDGNSIDNHLLVDDAAMESADYVELQTAADRDSYTIPALAAGVTAKAVKLSAYCGNGDGVNTTLDGFLRIGATDYDAANNLPAPLLYGLRTWIWEQNPATALAWAEDDLDGAEIGIERVA